MSVASSVSVVDVIFSRINHLQSLITKQLLVVPNTATVAAALMS